MDAQVDLDNLLLEVDGPKLDPWTVESAKLLEFGAAFLALLEQIAADDEKRLAFVGLAIEPKCVAIKVRPDNMEYARSASEISASFIRGEGIPRGLSTPVARVQDALRAFPAEYAFNVIAGPWKGSLVVPEANTAQPLPYAVENVRARIVRVGGTRPAVRARDLRYGDTFSIEVGEDQAIALAAYLYREVDLVLSVLRNADDKRIASCLKEFQPVSDEDPGEAWRRWFQPHADYWKGIPDIEETLRNRDRS